MESNKITNDQLQKFNLIRQDATEVASMLGELNFQKTVLDLAIQEQTEKIKDIKKMEAAFFQEIKEQYGEVQINLETGEYIKQST